MSGENYSIQQETGTSDINNNYYLSDEMFGGEMEENPAKGKTLLPAGNPQYLTLGGAVYGGNFYK